MTSNPWHSEESIIAAMRGDVMRFATGPQQAELQAANASRDQLRIGRAYVYRDRKRDSSAPRAVVHVEVVGGANG